MTPSARGLFAAWRGAAEALDGYATEDVAGLLSERLELAEAEARYYASLEELSIAA